MNGKISEKEKNKIRDLMLFVMEENINPFIEAAMGEKEFKKFKRWFFCCLNNDQYQEVFKELANNKSAANVFKQFRFLFREYYLKHGNRKEIPPIKTEFPPNRISIIRNLIYATRARREIEPFRKKLFGTEGAPFKKFNDFLQFIYSEREKEKTLNKPDYLFPDYYEKHCKDIAFELKFPVSKEGLLGKVRRFSSLVDNVTKWDYQNELMENSIFFFLTDIFPIQKSFTVQYFPYDSTSNYKRYSIAFDNSMSRQEIRERFWAFYYLHLEDNLPDINSMDSYQIVEFVLVNQQKGLELKEIWELWKKEKGIIQNKSREFTDWKNEFKRKLNNLSPIMGNYEKIKTGEEIRKVCFTTFMATVKVPQCPWTLPVDLNKNYRMFGEKEGFGNFFDGYEKLIKSPPTSN